MSQGGCSRWLEVGAKPGLKRGLLHAVSRMEISPDRFCPSPDENRSCQDASQRYLFINSRAIRTVVL